MYRGAERRGRRECWGWKSEKKKEQREECGEVQRAGIVQESEEKRGQRARRGGKESVLFLAKNQN